MIYRRAVLSVSTALFGGNNFFGGLVGGYEDFYIYTIAHAYKHYAGGGTGLRTIVDTYLYNKSYQVNLNMKYIQNECEKLGIAQFERQLRELSMRLLGGHKLTSEEQYMFDYIVFSGTYGTIQNRVNNSITNDKHGCFSSFKYIIARLQIPISKKNPHYRLISAYYPWFYKSKLRLPLLFFYRIGKALTTRKNLSKAELSALFNVR